MTNLTKELITDAVHIFIISTRGKMEFILLKCIFSRIGVIIMNSNFQAMIFHSELQFK